MKLPYQWLRDYVDVGVDTVPPAEYSKRMTMSGSMVGSYERPADALSRVVCGRVCELARHPDSDHLWVCKVDVGNGEPLQIVTGAQNLKVGDLCPTALDGSRLPGGVEIHAGKLRGVESAGMLCSMGELGLTAHDCPYGVEDGILVLEPGMGKPGDDAAAVLGLDEYIFDFDILHNRPDCMSILGLARESAAVFQKELRLPAPVVEHTEGDIAELLSVEIEDPALCPRYCAAMAKDIRIAPSPQWMRDRLRGAGIRPINNIVDITNYVMLEYGQPMHAFDYACIEGKKIIVRRGREGERTVTLDGQTRELGPDTLLITDPAKCDGIAGVMGGENSEITEHTHMIVFESACFDPVSVRTASRRMGLRTEASGRFERGLDCENAMPALLRACQLVEQLGAGTVIGGIVDAYPIPKQARRLTLDPQAVRTLLGAHDIPEDFMHQTLRALGFTVEGSDVTVPFWRDDCEGAADLAEEIGRLWGYDRIPTTLPAARGARGGLNEEQRFRRTLTDAARAAGYSEAQTFSFLSPKALERMRWADGDPRHTAVAIRNPLGEDQSLMRTSPLPSLLDVAARNYNFRASELRLYESGSVYLPRLDAQSRVLPDELPEERRYLALIAYGGDFYDLKGAVETILAAAGTHEPRFSPCMDEPSYHPGRCARIEAGGQSVGLLGQVHPTVADSFGVGCAVYAAELDIAALMAARAPARLYRPLPRYPAVTRDLALTCAEEIAVGQLEDAIRTGAGEALEQLHLFDVYRGAQVGEGRKSVAFSLTLRAGDHTLTDGEADALLAGALARLAADCGAELRA